MKEFLTVTLLFLLTFIIMLIFIHGMWCGSQAWKNFIEYFKARNYECKAVDLKEGFDLRHVCFMDYVDKVASMAGKDDVLIGHSMGGLIVQKVAEQKKIKGGVAICSAPPKGIKYSNLAMKLHSLKFLPRIIMNKPVKPDLKLVQSFLANCVDKEKIEKIWDKVEAEGARVVYELATGKIAVDEKKIRCPLLFIATKDDRASPPNMVEKIARKYNAEFVVKDGCHWIFDDWEEIAGEIAKFLVKVYG